ncbi:MAG: hypothetical protein J7L45_01495 [Candidatus Aenigmarchaeota archaeon]|nr:hypothetical protein [Candidatus Aenigmarchaeota archaeon]
MKGYSFGVHFYGHPIKGPDFVADLLDAITGESVDGVLRSMIFESKIDPDIYIYKGDTQEKWYEKYDAVIFTVKDEKISKVKELEDDFRRFENLDSRIGEIMEDVERREEHHLERYYEVTSELYKKEEIEKILKKYGQNKIEEVSRR